MGQLIERFRLVRIYSNGDGRSSGVKFFLSTRLAAFFGIQAGDLFSLRRAEGGALELVPVYAPKVDPFQATYAPTPAAISSTPAPPTARRQLFERRRRAEVA